MNTALTNKTWNTHIKEAMEFLNNHKLLKALILILVTVATCNAVYELGTNFGRFLYLIMH